MKKLNLSELRDLEFTLSNGVTYQFSKLLDLKIYANNTVYINNQKIQVSTSDVEILENVEILFFLVDAESVELTEFGYIKQSNRFTSYFADKNDAFKLRFENILIDNNIKLIK